MSHKGYFKHPYHSQGSEGNVGSPMPHLTLPTLPLLGRNISGIQNWWFHPPRVKVEGKCLERAPRMSQVRFSLQVPSDVQAGMSVNDTPTKRMSVHKSPQTLKPNERAQSDTPTELASKTPLKAQTLRLDNYMTKEEFVREISRRDQEIASLKTRLQLTEVNLSLTQAVVHAIQEQLAALSTNPISSVKDYSTKGEKKTQEEKVDASVEGKGKEIVTKGESSFSHVLEEGEID